MNPQRRFLYEVINRGLELAVIAPADVLQHVTADVLAHHLPIALKAKLLQASLGAERMTPELVVQVVGVDALAEHVPMAILWACVRACAARQLQSQSDDSLGASLGIAPAGSPAGANGGDAPLGDDLQLKPPRAARISSLRSGGAPPPRISALSPRSQGLRRGPDAVSGAITSGGMELGRADSVPDFEIVEETEVPARYRGGERISDDDAPPGSKS